MRMGKKGDLFWELLEPEYLGAMMFCRKLAGDRDRGDDLYQDALVLAFTNFQDLRDRSAFRPWLYRILITSFRATVRRPWWKRRVPMTPEVELRLTGPDPIDEYTARRWLNRAFGMISSEEQALVTLYELEDWTIGELAELYNKSENAVKAQLFRARRKLKKALLKFSRSPKRSMDAIDGTTEDDLCTAVKPDAD